MPFAWLLNFWELFFQIDDVTDSMCQEIICKFEPVEEWREKQCLGIDGKFN